MAQWLLGACVFPSGLISVVPDERDPHAVSGSMFPVGGIIPVTSVEPKYLDDSESKTRNFTNLNVIIGGH